MKRDCPHLDRLELARNKRVKNEERVLADTRFVSKDFRVPKRYSSRLKRLARRLSRFVLRQADRLAVFEAQVELGYDRYRRRVDKRDISDARQRMLNSSISPRPIVFGPAQMV